MLDIRQDQPQILGFIVNAKGITWNLKQQSKYLNTTKNGG